MLSALFSHCTSTDYRYEGKDHSDSESTSRPQGVEVKLRLCIHEIYLTLFVQTLIIFCKFFCIENGL